MTGPVCHNAFVTDDNTPSSSSASCSTYNTDDDDSSDGEENDSFDDDYRTSPNGNKWTTADGYNLTTFNQTECGSWAIEQPLPLPLWAAKSKEHLVIDKVSFILLFT